MSIKRQKDKKTFFALFWGKKISSKTKTLSSKK